jgi:hypothetical protein
MYERAYDRIVHQLFPFLLYEYSVILLWIMELADVAAMSYRPKGHPELHTSYAALFNQKYITENAMVWAEGEAEWQPLKASHKLYEALVFQGKPCSSMACQLKGSFALRKGSKCLMKQYSIHLAVVCKS